MKKERKVRSCAVCGGANRTRQWPCCSFDCLVEHYRGIEREKAKRHAEKYADYFPFWSPEVVADYQRECAKVRAEEAARRPRLVEKRAEGGCTVYVLSPDAHSAREAERAQSERWRQEGIEEAERKRRAMEAEGWISSADYPPSKEALATIERVLKWKEAREAKAKAKRQPRAARVQEATDG